MFSTEFNGYKKEEVDKYITSLKKEHEKALMEEKLKVLEYEKKMLDLRKKAAEIDNREKNIMNALESFKKIQAEGNKNIEFLKVEQLKVVYLHLQSFLNELNEKYPGVLINSSYKKLINIIEGILAKNEAKKEDAVNSRIENDPMRILLNKMQEKKIQENPREIKIERLDRKNSRFSQIEPVTSMKLEKNDGYDSLVDKFLNTAPEEEQPKSLKINSNSFDLKEAVNPKDDLDEIMKAFDFYSSDNTANPDDYDF